MFNSFYSLEWNIILKVSHFTNLIWYMYHLVSHLFTMLSTIGHVVVLEPWTTIVLIKARRQSREAVPSLMEKWENGLWETISCQSLEITITFEGVLLLSLVSERWLNVSLTAGVTSTKALGPDELLCLFAQLILMSAMAVQIRAYGPLSSQDGGQPQLVALTCMRLCKSAGRQGVWGRSWSICTHVCVF